MLNKYLTNKIYPTLNFIYFEFHKNTGPYFSGYVTVKMASPRQPARSGNGYEVLWNQRDRHLNIATLQNVWLKNYQRNVLDY